MADERDTLSGEAFGHQEVPDWLKDVPEPEPSTDQAPVEEASPEEAEAPTTDLVASEEAPEETRPAADEQQVVDPPAPEAQEEQEAETETEAEAEARKWAGRYESPEKLEAGYKELQREYTRTSQRSRELESQMEQYSEALKRVAPYLQQMQQEQMQDLPESREEIAKMMEERLATEKQEWQRTQSEQFARAEVEAFKAANPDVAQSDLAEDIARIARDYQAEDPESFPITRQNLEVFRELALDPRLYRMVEDLTVDPTDPMLLGAAKEAVDNPALAEVLLAQPSLLERGEHGLNWAKKQVGEQPVAPARTVRPNPNAKKDAFVEKDSAGTPTASTEDDDAKAIGLDIWRAEKKSAFGV